MGSCKEINIQISMEYLTSMNLIRQILTISILTITFAIVCTIYIDIFKVTL